MGASKPSVFFSRFYENSRNQEYLSLLQLQLKVQLKQSLKMQIKFRVSEEGRKRKKKISRHLLDQNWADGSFGRWTPEEQNKYIEFMRKHYYIMRSSQLRYHHRIFNDMADYIGTRTSNQCKSHHQKMMQKFQNKIENIIFKPCRHQKILEITPDEDVEGQKTMIREGIQNVTMGPDCPWFIVKNGGALTIVINQKTMASY